MRIGIAIAAALAAVLGIVLLAGADPSDGPRVYAAASLRSAFPALDAKASYNFAGSDQLQMQIERGAPADVFASASPQEPQALYAGGHCSRPQTFATNRLVLLVPKGNPGGITSVATLRSGGRRLAIGTAGVPVGDYTRQVVKALGLKLEKNTVSEESNVTGIVAKVANRSADAGFAYVTDAKAAASEVDTVDLPRGSQPPVRYSVCAVTRDGARTQAASAWIKRLLGSDGRRALARYGFGLP